MRWQRQPGLPRTSCSTPKKGAERRVGELESGFLPRCTRVCLSPGGGLTILVPGAPGAGDASEQRDNLDLLKAPEQQRGGCPVSPRYELQARLNSTNWPTNESAGSRSRRLSKGVRRDPRACYGLNDAVTRIRTNMLRARKLVERGCGSLTWSRTGGVTVRVELGRAPGFEKTRGQRQAIDKPIAGSLPISSHAVCWIDAVVWTSEVRRHFLRPERQRPR